MSIRDRLRHGSAAQNGSHGAGSAGDQQLAIEQFPIEQLPIAGYNRLEAKDVHLHTVQPVPGYDKLAPEQILEALAGANGQTLRAVRDYERKFRRRQAVEGEIACMLPSAQPSAAEARSREEKDARVRGRSK